MPVGALSRFPLGAIRKLAGRVVYSDALQRTSVAYRFRRTRRRGSIRYEPGDITQSRFEANAFDAIVCQSVLEHGVAVPAYLQEMSRILKPGGLLITSIDYWADGVDTPDDVPDGSPYHIFTESDMRTIFSTADSCGLRLTDPIDLACRERAIERPRFGLEYTYLVFTLRKTAASNVVSRA